VPTHDDETLLQSVIAAFGLRLTHIVRVAQRLAGELNMPSVSRNHLMRIAKGQASATAERIFIIVAAVNELTGRAFRAADLFRLDPLPTGPRPPAAAPDSSNSWVPLSSGRSRLSRIWRILVAEEIDESQEQSFEKLYGEYAVLLRQIAIRRYRIPPDDAEALVNDTFVAYLERHTYIRNLKGWLSGTVAHQCADYWHARQREAPLLPEHDDRADERQQATLQAMERHLTVSSVLARLGEKCRETLHGFFFKGEEQQALADRLATTPGYIDQLISTCRRQAMKLFRSLSSRSR
jgi:RNA polymerase sigma factor (sigma-70 family)